jgi:hypothetical protein
MDYGLLLWIYGLMDWATVKTQVSYCSISYLFIAFVGFIAVLVQTTCFGSGGGPKHVVCTRTAMKAMKSTNAINK